MLHISKGRSYVLYVGSEYESNYRWINNVKRKGKFPLRHVAQLDYKYLRAQLNAVSCFPPMIETTEKPTAKSLQLSCRLQLGWQSSSDVNCKAGGLIPGLSWWCVSLSNAPNCDIILTFNFLPFTRKDFLFGERNGHHKGGNTVSGT